MLPSLLYHEDVGLCKKGGISAETLQQICIQDSLHMLGRRSILAGIGHSPAALQWICGAYNACYRSADVAESTRLEALSESTMLLVSSQESLVSQTGT